MKCTCAQLDDSYCDACQAADEVVEDALLDDPQLEGLVNEDGMGDIEDPPEYLTVLGDNYADMADREGEPGPVTALAAMEWMAADEGVTLKQIAAAEGLTLQQWIDKQQEQYRSKGAAPGVAYLDEVDDFRQDLQSTEVDLSGAVSVIRDALRAMSAATIPSDVTTAIKMVEKSVATAHALSKKGRFEKAEASLEQAIEAAQAIIRDEMFRDAAASASGDRHVRAAAKVPAVSLHLASEGEDHLAAAYRSFTDLKLSMDKMENLPPYLQSLYKATLKAMSSAGKAKQDAAQVSGLARRVASKVSR